MTESRAAGAPRSYTMVGMGGVGGYYGAKLIAAGHPVRFLVRSGIEEIRRHGLLLTSPDGDIAVRDVAAYDRPDDVPPSDVVVIAVKSTDTEPVTAMLARLVGPHTEAVLVLQNGLGVEAPVAAAVPDVPVLGGMCFLCSHHEGPGRIRHLDYGRVTVGRFTPDGRPGGVTPEVAAVADDLAAAGLPTVRLDDLVTGRWRKLVWNVPYNGLSVVLDATTEELMTHPHTRALVETLMHEVLDGAAACGHPIEREFVQTMLEDTDRMAPYAPSMKLDHDAGRPLELDAIYQAPLDAARAAGAPMRAAEALHQQLRFLSGRGRGS